MSTLAPEIAAAVGDPSRLRTRAIERVAYANDASHYLLTPRPWSSPPMRRRSARSCARGPRPRGPR